MSEPLDDFSSCPPLPTGEDHTTTDPAAINTPVSDFRRNEARHILADDGKKLIQCGFFIIYLHI